jgi:hypothetical protein
VKKNKRALKCLEINQNIKNNNVKEMISIKHFILSEPIIIIKKETIIKFLL